MLSKNHSYFDRELRVDGHYIITGKTNDQFCSDTLRITDVLFELHRYLKYEEKFDAVIFVDSSSILYCLDELSYQVLRGDEGEPQEEEEGLSELEQILLADGPYGGYLAEESNVQQQRGPGEDYSRWTLPFGGDLRHAWQHLDGVFRQKELDCALVLTNASDMWQDQTAAIKYGEKFMQEVASMGGDNRNVIVSVFRETSLDDVESWNEYAQSVLNPRINAQDPKRNRVISLGSPNRWECRNLLNHLQLTGELTVKKTDLGLLAEIFSNVCARKNWGLSNLLERLRAHAAQNQGIVLSMRTWKQFTEDENYKTPLEVLENMIGQEKLKEQIRLWYAKQERERIVAAENDAITPRFSSRFRPVERLVDNPGLGMNIALMGEPGTGKSTIAEVIGQMYYDLGFLPRGHMVQRSVGQLTDGNPGEQVRLAVQEALGGVLFIEEAYAFNDDPSGIQAIHQLTEDMTRYKGQFAVVIAGYERPIENLISQNDGLAGRFGTKFYLDNYSADELRRIFYHMVEKNPGLRVGESFDEIAEDFFENIYGGRDRKWQNAREMEKLLKAMEYNAASRAVIENNASEVLELTIQDIPAHLEHCIKPRLKNIDDAIAKINKDIVGMTNVKKFLVDLAQDVRINGTKRAPGNFIFSGPPGTGKTMVAQLIGDIFGLLGVLDRTTNNVAKYTVDQILEEQRRYQIDNRNQNRTGSALENMVDSARGGVFFLDEAHRLLDTDEGQRILRDFVPLIEDPAIHADTCFIFAGYAAPMRRVLEVDQGLSSRFPERNRVKFTDYNAHELCLILQQMAEKSGNMPTEEYLRRSRIAISKYLEHREQYFGNGRYIREKFLPASIAARTRRLNHLLTGSYDLIPTPEQVRELTAKELHELTEHDLPIDMAAYAGPVGAYVPDITWSAESELHKLVGKEELKQFALSYVRVDSEQTFLDTASDTGLHYAVIGPAGTGRHTVVKAISKLWCEYGLLDTDFVRNVSKGDLEAGWVGQSNIKTTEEIENALGGTLCVNYPSTLLQKTGTDNSFGPEVLANLLGAIRAHHSNFSMVYIDTEEGFERLLKAQPELQGSMKVFRLANLEPDEMYGIFKEKTDLIYKFEPEVDGLLKDFFFNWVTNRGGLGEGIRSWTNGNEVDRLVDNLRINWTNGNGEAKLDVIKEGDTEYSLWRRYITRDHFPKELLKFMKNSSENEKEAMQKLQDLTGLDRVKDTVKTVERRIRHLGTNYVKPGCYLYLGNPGVGKTKVARLMGGVLKASNSLENGHVICRTAAEMCSQLNEFDELIKLAKNGILFIDEAHQLADHNVGNEVLKRLLTVLEDDEVTSKTAIILAGYPREMLHMLQVDSGLASRFGAEESLVFFDDYDEEEMKGIMEYMAANVEEFPAIGSPVALTLTEKFIELSMQVFRHIKEKKDPNFGNARFVRNYLHDALNTHLENLDNEYGEHNVIDKNVQFTLTEHDLPKRYHQIISAVKPKPATVLDAQLNTKPYAGPFDGFNSYIEEMKACVVMLECVYRNGAESIGTGMLLTEDGLVLTAEHVIKHEGEIAEKINVRFRVPGAPGGDLRKFTAEILEPTLHGIDMALIRVHGHNFPTVPLRPCSTGSGDKPHSGQRVVKFGFPLGETLNEDRDTLQVSVQQHLITSKQTVASSGRELIFINSVSYHGESGGPVISTEDGRVVGMFVGARRDKGTESEMDAFISIDYFWDNFVTPTRWGNS